MSISLQDVLRYCNDLLEVDSFSDYCPNGLQVEASPLVSRIVSGVTASEALIDAAIERKADLLLVHHGYFWKGESQVVTGIKARRIKKLLEHGISLMAYHLPLDAHPEIGNNAQLAKLLDWQVEGGLGTGTRPVGNVGRVSVDTDLLGLSEHIAQVLGRVPTVIGDLSKPVRRIAWCTGAAQSYIDKACDAGVDCFISGEISEPTVHIARERDIAYISAGHHATERYGVKALGEALAAAFAVPCEFVDIDNPV